MVEPLAPVELNASAKLPAVVLFSNLVGECSWLHLLRFTALGMPVVALKLARAEPLSSKTLEGSIDRRGACLRVINLDDAESSTLKQLHR